MCVLLWRHWKSYPRNLSYNGTRVLVTLIHALADRQLRRGLATLCLGGGDAVALSVERVD